MSHLKKILAKHGISQTDLADILRRDKAVITNLLQGKRRLKADEAAVIASHIGVPVAQVLGIEEQTGYGFKEPEMRIPFQHEPVHSKKWTNVVKKDGKYYLEMEGSSGYSLKAFALEARDNSMNMSGILEGDIVISELDRSCKPRQIVIAQHYQGRGAKTLIRLYDPPFLLAQSNDFSFKPLSIEHDNVRLVSPVLKLIRVF